MNQLHFSPSAQQDLLEIKQYIEEELRNPTAAESTVQRILQSLHILKQYAQAGTPLATLTAVKTDYRFITGGNLHEFLSHPANRHLHRPYFVFAPGLSSHLAATGTVR